MTAAKTDFGGGYSFDEVNTGFKWIDGKDIYKKVIDFGALPNAALKSVVHDITALDSLVNIRGMATSGSIYIFIPHTNPTAVSGEIQIYTDTTNINILTGSDRSAYNSCYVIMEYTKS